MNVFSKLLAVVAAVSVGVSATPFPTGSGSATEVRADADVASGFYVELGDLLTGLQRFGAARQAYSEAVKSDRAMGWLPVEGLRRIANAYYFEGNYSAAVTILEDLAAEAGASQDKEIQAWALADAAWLAVLGGDESAATETVERLNRLCLADDSLGEVCRIVSDGLMAGFAVFAPHLASW